MQPSVVYVAPASSLHGGIRVIFEHAEGLTDRGYRVTVVGPEPPPDWHPVRVPYRQVPVGEPGAVPAADIAIGTFWTTVEPARRSGAPHVFHLCQGFEGVHREYAPVLGQIDATYRLPVPKLLISEHLRPILEQRYGARCHVLGQAVDTELFRPGPGSDRTGAGLRVGIVGPFGIRSKGIPEALRGIALARRRGLPLEVHRASAEPLAEEEGALGVVDRYHHRVPTSQMPAFYRDLHVLLHPSYDEEGFPLPPLEAMACGVAVAASEIGYTRSLPEDALLRFPPGDPDAVARTLRTLTDAERRERLAAAGLACARRHTLDRVLDRLEGAFLAEGAPRPSPAGVAPSGR